jgi:threonine synthase
MGELSGENVVNISVDGVFDDCQDLVKSIKADPEFAHLGAVNSINWGRVAFQIPYYFAGYAQVMGSDVGREIDVVVPSGNFGNILAGYYAKKMGLPIRRLIIATNSNNVLDTLVQTGEYQKTTSETTASPSMDISAASNYERVVLDIMGGDTEKTRLYMEQFGQTGSVAFKDFDLPMDTMKRFGFDSGSAGHMQTVKAIQWAYRQAGRVIDPHTAVGVSVAQRFAEDGVPILCMSTALPVKFEDTIHQALGFVPERPERFVGLEERTKDKEDAFIVVPNDIDAVKAILRSRGFANAA